MTVELGHDHALYSISVTSELTGVNPQMLRMYENKGLLAPYRTEGGTRRYSGQDLDRITQISTLLAAGLNLAGVERVLHLQAETERLQAEIDQTRARAAQLPPTPNAASSTRIRVATAKTPCTATTGIGSAARPAPGWRPGSRRRWNHLR
jgi:MerR family transcriptional regulator/heat shock protein HspR